MSEKVPQTIGNCVHLYLTSFGLTPCIGGRVLYGLHREQDWTISRIEGSYTEQVYFSNETPLSYLWSW